MFSDPLSVTYNGSAKSLPRISGAVSGPNSGSTYATADGEFSVFITRTRLKDTTEVEIQLQRITPDPDSAFTGDYLRLPNSFGMKFVVNNLNYATATDIPLLQSALTSLVDATFRGRLLGGES